ncbi:MAG: hypothetical protein Q9187_002084 [Circinaria calcarea]
MGIFSDLYATLSFSEAHAEVPEVEPAQVVEEQQPGDSKEEESDEKEEEAEEGGEDDAQEPEEEAEEEEEEEEDSALDQPNALPQKATTSIASSALQRSMRTPTTKGQKRTVSRNSSTSPIVPPSVRHPSFSGYSNKSYQSLYRIGERLRGLTR